MLLLDNLESIGSFFYKLGKALEVFLGQIGKFEKKMLEEKLDTTVIAKLRLQDKKEPDLKVWKNFLKKLKNPKNKVSIGLVGKYNELQDAYKSIHESFVHGGALNNCKVNVIPVHSERMEDLTDKELEELISSFDGILVAPGFGERGVEGKIKTIKIVRERQIPFFGICLGMQCAAVEFARNALEIEGAASTEVNPETPNPIIDLMPGQKEITKKEKEASLNMEPLGIHKFQLSLDYLAGTQVRPLLKYIKKLGSSPQKESKLSKPELELEAREDNWIGLWELKESFEGSKKDLYSFLAEQEFLGKHSENMLKEYFFLLTQSFGAGWRWTEENVSVEGKTFPKVYAK